MLIFQSCPVPWNYYAYGGRGKVEMDSPDSVTKAHPASSGVACGLSTELFCYFHNLVISKLPKVGAGSELSVTAHGFSSIEVFVLVLLFTGPLLLAVCFSLKCALSTLPCKCTWWRKWQKMRLWLPDPNLTWAVWEGPLGNLFLCYFQFSLQIPRSLAKTSRQPSLE